MLNYYSRISGLIFLALLAATRVQSAALDFETSVVALQLPGGIDSTLVAVVDLNADELPDVLIADNAQKKLWIMRRYPGRPDAWKILDFPITKPILGLLAADLDQDLKPDLLLARPDGLWLYKNTGLLWQENKGRQISRRKFSVLKPVMLEIADINGDSELDILVFTDGGGDTDLYFAESGEYRRQNLAMLLPAADCCLVRPQLIDTNIDARPDYVGIKDNQLQLRLNQGDGTFSRVLTVPIPVKRIESVRVFDLDADKKQDIVLTVDTGQENQLLLLQQSGKSGFRQQEVKLRDWQGKYFTLDALVDIDNDGLAELLLRARGSAGEFSATAVFSLDESAQELEYSRSKAITGQRLLASADFDRDGQADFLALDKQGQLRFWHNTSRSKKPKHWVSVRLRGQNMQPVVGSSILIRMKDGRGLMQQYRVFNDGGLSQEQAELLFGLNRNTSITQLEIFWTKQRYTRMDEPQINRRIGFIQPDKDTGRRISIQHPILDFTESDLLK